MSKARHYTTILSYIYLKIYIYIFIYIWHILPIHACCRQEFTFTHVVFTNSCNFSATYFDLFCRLFLKTETNDGCYKVVYMLCIFLELKLGVANAKQIVLMMRCLVEIFEIISNINKLRLKAQRWNLQSLYEFIAVICTLGSLWEFID